MAYWEACGRTIISGTVPRVMGIVNVTPDSFSDGGRASECGAAVAQALGLLDAGADLLDIGGESTRPGSQPVALDEELRRVVPVIEGVADRSRAPLSVDTSKAEVARRAIRAGARIVNDISALAREPDMVRVVSESGAGVILMHMRGEPATMQDDPRYDDVVAEIYEFLARRIEWAESRGIARARIAVDPGIGFGKTLEHNLALLRNLARFANLGCALLVGTSRKGFLGALTGRPVDRRAAASVASALAAVAQGANIVRVHDVAETADALKVWTALRSSGVSPDDE